LAFGEITIFIAEKSGFVNLNQRKKCNEKNPFFGA